MIQVFGIKNCDTVKKSLKWLNDNRIEYQFRDFKKEILNSTQVATWLEKVDPTILINRRGTTWRKLTEQQKAIIDRDELIALIIDNTSLLKRPLIENGDSVSVGFNADEWQKKLG